MRPCVVVAYSSFRVRLLKELTFSRHAPIDFWSHHAGIIGFIYLKITHAGGRRLETDMQYDDLKAFALANGMGNLDRLFH